MKAMESMPYKKRAMQSRMMKRYKPSPSMGTVLGPGGVKATPSVPRPLPKSSGTSVDPTEEDETFTRAEAIKRRQQKGRLSQPVIRGGA